MSKKKFSKEDFEAIADLLWTQLHEDRERLVGQYSELRGMMSGNIDKFMVAR